MSTSKETLTKLLSVGITSGTWNGKSEPSPDSFYGGVVGPSLLKKNPKQQQKSPQSKKCKLKACTPTLNRPCQEPVERDIPGVLFSRTKGKWFFERNHTAECRGWKSLHALVAAAQTGRAKRMWTLRELLREDILSSGLGPLQEQKENHFYNQQITSWLFFPEGSRLCWAASYAWLLRSSPSSDSFQGGHW